MTSCRLVVVAIALAASLLPAGASSARNTVDVPADVPTIAEALELVDEGGLIRVAEGAHEGGFTITASVTIQGGYPPDFDGDADPWAHPTIVVGLDDESAMYAVLSTGDAVFLNGLICTAGQAGIDASLTGDASLSLSVLVCRESSRGLRIDAHDDSQVSASGLLVQDNSIDGTGAGLAASADGNASITVASSEITGNSATSGGAGAFIEAAGHAAVSFVDATSFSSNGYLNGVVESAPATLLYALTDAAALFLNGSRVEGDVPAQAGNAAIGGEQSVESLVQIEETEFREGEPGTGGEAIDARLSGISALRLLSNSFEDATGLTGPVLRITPDEQAVAHVLRNRFAANASIAPLVSTEQLGSSFLNFDGNVLRGNSTSTEVLVMTISTEAAGALLRVINNQVSENVATTGPGGGFFGVEGPNVAQVGHNTFYGNTAASGIAGIHLVASASSPAEVSNNALVENLAGGDPADLLVEGFLADAFSNFLTGDGDPGFLDPDQGDLHVLPNSPLVDAADPNAFEIDHDFEEDDRPFNDISDIGSDESILPPASVAGPYRPAWKGIRLGAPHPNPTRGALRYTIELPVGGGVDVRILDVSGRTVEVLLRQNLASGRHELEWLPRSEEHLPASGVFYLVLEAEGERRARRFVLTR